MQMNKNHLAIYRLWILNQPTPTREWPVGWVGWRWERSLSASRSGKRSRSRCSRRRTQMRRLGITTQYCCSAHKVNLFFSAKKGGAEGESSTGACWLVRTWIETATGVRSDRFSVQWQWGFGVLFQLDQEWIQSGLLKKAAHVWPSLFNVMLS